MSSFPIYFVYLHIHSVSLTKRHRNALSTKQELYMTKYNKIYHVFFRSCLTLMPFLTVSCSDNSTEDNKPAPNDTTINFSAMQQWDESNETRADETTTTSRFSSGAQIGVFAYYNDSQTPDFMNNQMVSTTDGMTWKYEPVKYWPTGAGDQIDFYAYSPYRAADDDTLKFTNDNGKPIITYDNLTANIDLMAAEAPKQMYANGKNGIELKYKHLLARIRFKFTVVESTNDDKGYKPVVHILRYKVPHIKASFSYKYSESENTPTLENLTNDGIINIERTVNVAAGKPATSTGTDIDEFTAYLYPCSFPCAEDGISPGEFIFSLNHIECKYPIQDSKKMIKVESGKSYTVNFNIKRNDSSTNFFITSYSIWEDGGEYEGELK